MYRRGYTLSRLGSFLIRRIKRIDPPYLACLPLIIALNVLSTFFPGYKGGPFSISYSQLGAHFAYLNAVLGYEWLSPVFWTLAIEFQYYILIAILFPLVCSSNKLTRTATLIALSSVVFFQISTANFVLYWLPLFCIGFGALHVCLHRDLSGILCMLWSASVAGFYIGWPHAIVGAGTGLAIAYMRHRECWKWLLPLSWLGTISYSLYLLHVTVGGRVINLGTRLPNEWPVRYGVVFTALFVSLAAAYCWWLLIEKPSQRWAAGSSFFKWSPFLANTMLDSNNNKAQ